MSSWQCNANRESAPLEEIMPGAGPNTTGAAAGIRQAGIGTSASSGRRDHSTEAGTTVGCSVAGAAKEVRH